MTPGRIVDLQAGVQMTEEYLAHIGDPIEAIFFDRCVDEVAAELVGCYLFADSQDDRVGGQIIEIESYCQNDPAAHCHPQAHLTRLEQSKPMLSAGGCIYLYPTRLHDYEDGQWCINLTCGHAGFGSALLVRALRPIVGLQIMRDRRKKYSGLGALEKNDKYEFELCNGPGNLWDALGWLDDREWNGKPFADAGLKIFRPSGKEQIDVSYGGRVGIAEGNPAREWPRGYILADASARKYLSKGARAKTRRPYLTSSPQDQELKGCGSFRSCDSVCR
jgi:DNA-3-methyladenine glycosylase